MKASLDGPRARIAVARQQIDRLDQLAKEFVKENPPRAVFEVSSKPGKVDIRVYDVRPVPLEFGVGIGMVVHNLRAALDGLACQLALVQSGGSGDANVICEHTQFPIYLWSQKSAKPGHREFPKRTNRRVSQFSGYLAMIEEFQPYKRKNGQARSPLWWLHELNNTDKHRVLPVVATTNRGVGLRPRLRPQPGGSVSASITGIQISAGLTLKEGTKIGHYDAASPDDVQMDVLMRPDLRFGTSCPAVARRLVADTLLDMCNSVSDVTESFRSEF
ncbi:MAG: hypothetical protein KC482_02440 [Dehalococcoidia bacterium]|nr:hypothetical protein [Dehalococcoidia bacterium]